MAMYIHQKNPAGALISPRLSMALTFLACAILATTTNMQK